MDRKLKVRSKSKVAFQVKEGKAPEKIVELIEEENEIYCEKFIDEDESSEDGSKKLERKFRKKKSVFKIEGYSTLVNNHPCSE